MFNNGGRRRSWRNEIDDFLKRTFECLPARIALAIMAWFGFVNLYMTRINLSVAIVAMVKRNISSGNTAICQTHQSSNYQNISQFNGSQDYNDNTDDLASSSQSGVQEDQQGDFSWDETTQGLVLGSFFYGYACTQIVGGRLAELYGTKMVYGFCILGSGFFALLSPVVAKMHYGAFIFLRIIHGMFQGVSWPSMHACTARWIPPIERPRFVAIVYLAATLSSAITMPLCGVIIASYGWESQFYVMGALSLLWCCFWFSFMHNSPDEHPRISPHELNYIKTALIESGTKKNRSKMVPWREIWTSFPFWAILFYSVGNGWGISLFFAQLPTYMSNVLGFSLKANGALSALPFLCRYIGGIITSSLGDWLISREYLTVRNTRRVFCVTSLIVPGILILGVSFAGCNANLTVALFCLALFCNGSTTTSGLVNHTDIAPNFAGTLLGIDNTVGSIVAFIVPIVTGVMIDGQQTLEAWQRVFWICSPIYILGALMFLRFVSGEVQPWNDVDSLKASKRLHMRSDAKHKSEGMALKTTSN